MDVLPFTERNELVPNSADPVEELLWSVVHQLVSIAAVAYGSHFALRRWIAVQSLQTSLHKPEGKPMTPPVETATPAPRGWRRFLKPGSLTAFTWAIGLVGFGMVQIYGSSKLLSTLILDCLWTAFEFWLFCSVTEVGVMVLWPFPSFVQYKPSTKSQAILLSYSTDTGEAWYPKVVSAMLSGLVLCTSAVDSRWLQNIVVGAFVLMAFTPVEQPRMVVKTLLYVINGLLALTGVLTSVIVAGITFFGPFSQDAMRSQPSPWLTRLMTLPMAAMPAAFSGFIIAMALRYDYSTSLQLFDRPQIEASERIELPASTPQFKKPTYTAAMLGLITSLVTLDTGKYLFPKLLEGGDAGDVCWMFVTIPLISLCTMYPHWRNGTVGNWWGYEERWWWGSNDKDKEDTPVESHSSPALSTLDEKLHVVSTP